MNVRSVFVLSVVTVVSACTTPPKEPARAEWPIAATVVWGNQGRGGAAERLPGYVHVLRRSSSVYRATLASPEPLPTSYSEWLSPPTVSALPAVSVRNAKPELFVRKAAASVSNESRRAWEKYCDGGYGMTDEEWHLVREAGAPDNVPASLAGRCVHPK